MANDKVTIITVVFNAKEYIEETIKSVIEQSYDNLEYIIIDGGSTDGTLDIIKKYESKVDYFISEKDKGIYDAMNKGIIAASGDWINFMNAGDRFYSNNILKEIFSSRLINGYDILYGDHIVKYDSYEKHIKSGNDISLLWKGSQFSHQSAFIKSAYHKQHLYNVQNKITADYEFFYLAFKRNKKFLKIEKIVSVFAAGGVSDIKRIDSLISCWNILDKTFKINMYYIFRILSETLKMVLKNLR